MISWSFFLLVVLLSVPLGVVGAIVGRLPPEAVPINLPVSALIAFNPLLAAAILVYRERGWHGVKALLRRAVDYPRIERKVWLVPVLGLMPLTAVLEYLVMRLIGAPLPDPPVPMLLAPVMLVAFAVSAAGEELGWQAYAFDRLPRQWSALGIASLGAVDPGALPLRPPPPVAHP